MIQSAGVLLYRYRADGVLEVLLAHPGGPFWAKRDAGSWSIPKGGIEEGESPLVAARREFLEEMGHEPPADGIALVPVKQPSRKVVHVWAMQGDCDAAAIRSMTFEMEYPPRSGRMQSFPEVDRAGWFTLAQAREKLLKGQLPFLDQLELALSPGAKK